MPARLGKSTLGANVHPARGAARAALDPVKRESRAGDDRTATRSRRRRLGENGLADLAPRERYGPLRERRSDASRHGGNGAGGRGRRASVKRGRRAEPSRREEARDPRRNADGSFVGETNLIVANSVGIPFGDWPHEVNQVNSTPFVDPMSTM